MLVRPFLGNVLLAAAVCVTLCVHASALRAATSHTYDTTPYEAMAKEALKLVAAGDMKGASETAKKLEAKWDAETNELRAADPDLWDLIDKQMDAAIAALSTTDTKKAINELNSYLEKVARVPKPEKK